MSTPVPGHRGSVSELPLLPAGREAATTAVWIQAVVSGERPVPEAIARQVDAIVRALESMRAEASPAVLAEVA